MKNILFQPYFPKKDWEKCKNVKYFFSSLGSESFFCFSCKNVKFFIPALALRVFFFVFLVKMWIFLFQPWLWEWTLGTHNIGPSYPCASKIWWYMIYAPVRSIWWQWCWWWSSLRICGTVPKIKEGSRWWGLKVLSRITHVSWWTNSGWKLVSQEPICTGMTSMINDQH